MDSAKKCVIWLTPQPACRILRGVEQTNKGDTRMHKYTSDGKKVAVIGKLNATETIVQEIFATKDGGEIPSGEQFVTKSLHDAPVVSWKEKKEKEISDRLASLEKAFEKRTDELRREMHNAACRISALKTVASQASMESLDMLEAFVSGRITHVVDTGYGGCHIYPFAKAIEPGSDGWRQEEWIKLLSLFGKSDGTLQWRIHQYYDNSGNTRDILPAMSYAHAVQIAQGIYDERAAAWRNGKPDIRPFTSDWCKDLGEKVIPMQIPDDVRAYWEKVKAENKATRIARAKAELEAALSS